MDFAKAGVLRNFHSLIPTGASTAVTVVVIPQLPQELPVRAWQKWKAARGSGKDFFIFISYGRDCE